MEGSADVPTDALGSSEKKSEETRILSRDEVRQLAQIDLANTGIASEEIDSFTEHVTILRHQGVDLTFIDWDYFANPELSPPFLGYIGAPRTRIVVNEYFEPELVKSSKPGKPISEIIEEKIEEVETDLAAGKPGDTWSRRLRYSRQMAAACKDAGKDVAVVDIANKPAYMIQRAISEMVTSATIDVPLTMYDMATQGLHKQGHFVYDAKKVHPAEELTLRLEDARRLFIAKGATQLTQEFRPLPADPADTPDELYRKKHPQIIIPYPEAHRRRVVDHIIHPDRFTRRAKNFIYRALAPNLDYSVRIWRYKNELSPENTSHSTSKPSSSDNNKWMRVSNRKI